ncbi:hypothetical protein V8G54_012612 [Vigna mungo]|uniref:Uncharacterized protein n=1 Tax=Vigna mungo TaxID=3915 RepID=A0AAQ3S3Z4_VIGMU
MEKKCKVPSLEEDLLMVRRLLGSINKEEDEIQSRNIFYSRCMVLRNVCSFLINEGSYTNDGELVVDKHVNMAFSIGKYVDEVICDVVEVKYESMLEFDRLGSKVEMDKSRMMTESG